MSRQVYKFIQRYNYSRSITPIFIVKIHSRQRHVSAL